MAFTDRLHNRGSISTGYDIDNSCKFESDNSEYLSKTPSSAGNQKTWTFSTWVKRTELGGTTNKSAMIFGSGDTYLHFTSSDKLIANLRTGGTNFFYYSDRVFRDTSAWYHFVLACDTTQSTATDRLKLYVNGVYESPTESNGYTNIAQNANTGINSTNEHEIGKYSLDETTYAELFNGYMAEMHLVDGTALDHTSFGETDEDSGIWKPKKYPGTYGTNGFYLKFDTLGTNESSHRYWRYESYSTTNHHPRVSRIYLIKSDGTEQNFKYYVADNCSDSGSIMNVASGSTTYSNDSNTHYDIDLGSGNADAARGFGFYSSYGDGSRNITARLYYSDDGSNWTLDTTHTINTRSANACGEYNRYRGAGLGTDSSGNGNNWTKTNITSADQATDTPTNNFCTWLSDGTLFNTGSDNMEFNEGGTRMKRLGGTGWTTHYGMMAASSGKWYFEHESAGANNTMMGAIPVNGTTDNTSGRNNHYLGNVAGHGVGYQFIDRYVYQAGTYFLNGGSNPNSGAIVQVALDLDNGKIYFGLDNNWLNQQTGSNPSTGSNGLSLAGWSSDQMWMFAGSSYNPNVTQSTNFGGYTEMSIDTPESDENGYGTFEYAPPTGFLALCSKNLAEYGG